jgi:hypothetical protein
MTSPMRTRAIFERKVGLFPKDLNTVTNAGVIDTLLLNKVKESMEGRCSQHGWVIPGTLKILSRSMCQNEAGRFTGAMVSWIQAEGEVYYPSDKMEIIGEVLKKNKMGLFVLFENAIQVMVPRDLHLGNEEYEAVEIGNYVRLELKKSRFQVNDKYILSVGEFKEIVEAPVQPPAIRVETADVVGEPAPGPASAAAAAAALPPMQPVPLSAIPEEDSAAAAAATAAAAESKEEEEDNEGILGAGDDVPAAKGTSIGDFF